jgi:hypothetical protein
MSPLAGFVYQASFVNKRIGIPDPAAPKPRLPHPLDAPDNPAEPECQVDPLPEQSLRNVSGPPGQQADHRSVEASARPASPPGRAGHPVLAGLPGRAGGVVNALR